MLVLLLLSSLSLVCIVSILTLWFLFYLIHNTTPIHQCFPLEANNRHIEVLSADVHKDSRWENVDLINLDIQFVALEWRHCSLLICTGATSLFIPLALALTICIHSISLCGSNKSFWLFFIRVYFFLWQQLRCGCPSDGWQDQPNECPRGLEGDRIQLFSTLRYITLPYPIDYHFILSKKLNLH